MRPVPWWALASSIVAPIALIGGWTVAAARQPGGFDSMTGTISALAGHAATDRWVMTAGLAVLGIAHIVTATGLRAAARPGRAVLAAGGVATILVSMLPLPRVGSSTAHGIAAGIGFVALALWPALSARRTAVAWGLRPPVAATAAVVLFGIVGWFALSLHAGSLVGLSERCAAGAQALWPLAVVLSVIRGAGDRTPEGSVV